MVLFSSFNMLLFVLILLNLAYNLIMIRKNKNINASSDVGKTEFGTLVRFVFITFALGLKKINFAELNLKNS